MFTAAVRGRTSTKRRGAFGALVAVAALAMVPAFAAPAHAAKNYVFTKVADSAADGFNPQTLRLACPSINNGGDIAFKSERGGVEGIFRVNADGTPLTTIAEVGTGVGADEITILGNANPSMNDFGQVSFEASLSDGSQIILRGDGTLPLTTIASTNAEFASFEEETAINNLGEVAFYSQLDGEPDPGPTGLFSGSGGATTTHYLNNAAVLVDGSPATFDGGPLNRPSINDNGDIAFRDAIQFDADIFRGQEGSFTTISSANPPQGELPPLLNNGGTVAWQSSFIDDTGLFASSIVTGDGDGADTRVVDSSGALGEFQSFAFNNPGTVAFSSILEGDGNPSLFVGPNPKKNKVIGPGDKLDGGIVAGLRFCEEGLNDSGALAFVAEIEDRNGEVRAAVFRATPRG
jgi:hypothetical protein